jgi:hypothetical protein
MRRYKDFAGGTSRTLFPCVDSIHFLSFSFLLFQVCAGDISISGFVCTPLLAKKTMEQHRCRTLWALALLACLVAAVSAAASNSDLNAQRVVLEPSSLLLAPPAGWVSQTLSPSAVVPLTFAIKHRDSDLIMVRTSSRLIS